MCGCLSRAPYWGPGLKPRHVPWLGIKPATLCFTGRHPIHWATPARTSSCIFTGSPVDPQTITVWEGLVEKTDFSFFTKNTFCFPLAKSHRLQYQIQGWLLLPWFRSLPRQKSGLHDKNRLWQPLLMPLALPSSSSQRLPLCHWLVAIPVPCCNINAMSSASLPVLNLEGSDSFSSI